jgi:hypothetical protein
VRRGSMTAATTTAATQRLVEKGKALITLVD